MFTFSLTLTIDLNESNCKSLNVRIAGDILLDGSGDEILDSEGFPTTSDRITDFGGSTQDTTQPFGYLFGNYNYNGFYGRLFGYGGGNNINGYYRFSTEDNKIYMNVDFGYDKIILEYISDQSLSLIHISEPTRPY